MKQLNYLMLTLMLTCGFVACGDDDFSKDPEIPTQEDTETPEKLYYKERLVPVVTPQNESCGVITLRFYRDMPFVPYVNVSNFQSMMFPGTTIQTYKTADNQYVLTNPFGTATVDTDKDVFESDDYEAFTNMMGMVQLGMPNTTYDALPIIRWKSLEKQPQNVHVALDYGKFGIDLRADDKGVYFPFATIADLYVDGYMHLASFNGDVVMVAPNGAYSLLDGYPKFFITPILQETRSGDMADYAYRNQCFTLTNFFGYPGRTLLEESMHEKGLDQALQDYGKAGQMVRDLLRSTNMYEYIAGTATLGRMLDDGGHTYTDVTVISDLKGNMPFKTRVDSIVQVKKMEFESYCPESKAYTKVMNDRRAMAKELNQKRTEKIGKNVKYRKEGNTAYCWFDSFFCNDAGWRKYYKGEGAKPTTKTYPNDWLISLTGALDKAEKDPDVNNFILDISTNGGGSSDIVVFITSIFCNKNDIYYENVLTGQKMKCSYEVDRNLDGKFDEKDNEVKYHLNFALLTSCYSFSCGNLLPALLKDYGIPIIGQTSGGGSCCVLFNPSADGFGYRYSTHRARLNNTKGENIDEGITPTYTLDSTDDYFDIPKLTELVESYYK